MGGGREGERREGGEGGRGEGEGRERGVRSRGEKVNGWMIEKDGGVSE